MGRADPPGKALAAGIFKARVCLGGPYDAHHAVPRRTLINIARGRRAARHALGQTMHPHEFWGIVYDPRIGVPLTEEAHNRHTRKLAEIPLEALPSRVLEAAVEYGPEAVAALLREHPPRAEASADRLWRTLDSRG